MLEFLAISLLWTLQTFLLAWTCVMFHALNKHYHSSSLLVWTPHLMHRCMWKVYVEQDFPKSQFACHSLQLLVIAKRPPKLLTTMLRNEQTHMFLYVFGHCVENICWVCCWYWCQNLGGAPPQGSGMPFQNNDTCAEVGGYLFLLGFSSLYDAIHGWMTGRTNGQMDGRVTRKNFTKNNHSVFYYIIWTPF
jgi:hypothetical protein